MRTFSHHARRRIAPGPGRDLAAPTSHRASGQAGTIRRLLGRRTLQPEGGQIFRREGRSPVCACGGDCPTCREASRTSALFQRDQPAAAPDQDAPVRTPATDIQGFPVDEQFCDCDVQVEKEIEWVRTMAGIFDACRKESEGGKAEDAIRCKLRKLKEMGVKTVLAGSVGEQAQVNVEPWPGLCGPIFEHGVTLHEDVHRDFVAHGGAPEAVPDDKKMRDLSEVSARAYASDEIKAYRREERYLERVLKDLDQRCLPVRHRITNPEYYREVCGQLDLDLGLDMAPGDAWSRFQIHDSWPGLKGKCWWYLGPPGGGYNCYGHCLRGDGEPRVVEPALESGQTFDDFFRAQGYEPSGPTGDIALFSGSHVARRSSYSLGGRQLWESKLSREAPLILHELKDIEGDAFGKVIAYYSRTEQ